MVRGSGLIFGTLGLLALAAPARASAPGPADRSLEVGLYGGAFLVSAEHELYDSLQVHHAPMRPVALNLALRAGYFPIRFLGAEVEGGFSPQATSGGERLSLFSARAHAVVQLPARIAPFLVAGGGVLGVTGGSGTDFDRAIHWGGGIKLFPTDRVQVRFDGRHIVSAARGPGEGNTSHFEVTAGLSFTLWRGSREDRAVERELEVELARPAVPAAQPFVDPTLLALDRTSAAELVAEALHHVHFTFGASRIRANGLAALDRAVILFRMYPELGLKILGHADSVGSEARNLKLSEARARAVAAYLSAHGIAAERIELRGFGERLPRASNESFLGRAKNRRCELVVVSEDGEHLASRPGF